MGGRGFPQSKVQMVLARSCDVGKISSPPPWLWLQAPRPLPCLAPLSVFRLCLAPCPSIRCLRSTTTGRASALRRQRRRRRHLARGIRRFASRARDTVYAGEHGTARERGGTAGTLSGGGGTTRWSFAYLGRRRPSASTASPLIDPDHRKWIGRFLGTQGGR
jgi:hypothetical protein